MPGNLQSVLIVGRDVDAWLTALSLVRAFGRSGPKISILELPSVIGSSDVFSALPTLAGLHRLIGLNENDILRAGKGVSVLGQRYSNWSVSGEPFLHAYDSHGVGRDGEEFFQFWLRAKSEGLSVSLEDFSFGAAAAKNGKLLTPGSSIPAFSQAASGYNFDMGPYIAVLAKLAVDQGVEVVSGDFEAPVWDRGCISGIRLSDGTSVHADLYVDASGLGAQLISQIPDAKFSSWRDWLPCNMQMSMTAPRLSPMPAFTEVQAFKGGWVTMHPLRERTAIVAGFNSDITPVEDVARLIPMLTGAGVSGDGFVSPIVTGLRTPWIGNCVAIGAAAAGLEPLDAAPSHLLHVGISTLISLFPSRPSAMPEADVYNRIMADHAENLRDFQAAHYQMNTRFDEPFWDFARAAEPPAALQSRMDLFRSRGRVLTRENETLQQHNWISILNGHGLEPSSFGPGVYNVSQPDLMQFFKQILHEIAAGVRSLPALEAHMEMEAPMKPANLPGSF